jgi:Na+-transporting methylmalonyl-CoA/oxaloacetate decarboxylase gamma subunit
MISRLFLASGATLAAASDAGSMNTLKDVLLVAFLVVGIVWLLIDARRKLIAAYGDAAPVAVPAPAAAARAAVAGQPSPEVLAVIAAAVHTTFGSAANIVAISSSDESLTWAAEGRRAIYATRKVR